MLKIKRMQRTLLLLCLLFLGTYQLSAQKVPPSHRAVTETAKSDTAKDTQLQKANGSITSSKTTELTKVEKLTKYRKELYEARTFYKEIKKMEEAKLATPEMQKAIRKNQSKIKLLEKRIKDLQR